MTNIKKSLLIVGEYEDSFVGLLSEEFISAGYEVKVATEQKAVLEQFDACDVVVIDMQLKGYNTLELVQKMKDASASKPVIFLSDSTNIKIEEAYDKGAEAIFYKPVNIDGLLSTIRLALEPIDNKWQRKTIRVEARTNVEVKLTNLEDGAKLSILNLGKGGMFISMAGQLPKVSAFVKFKIVMDKHPEIQGTGVVRWVRDLPTTEMARGIGIEFIEFTENCRADFLKLLNSIKTNSFIPIT